MAEGRNPLTGMDYPDPDVIRVGSTRASGGQAAFSRFTYRPAAQ